MTRRTLLKLFILFLLASCSEKPIPQQSNIIPAPLEQVMAKGHFILDGSVNLVSENKLSLVSNYFESYLKNTYKLMFSNTKEDKSIYFQINNSIENEEGYTLTVTPLKILIESKTEKGAFYAVQSLLQLMPAKTKEKSITIPCTKIKDEPRFTYRGMHLDVGRHMYPVDFIKKYIDLMAMLKMNTFHWHLTEDQGWRIEIKKYPKLQEVAAYRKETLLGHYSDQPHQFDGKPYGGYYTQEEIKDIIAYAQQRQVTIIPEIEMPGHSQAAIAAYPELGCTNKKVAVATKWGVFEEVYCPKESTFKFLEDVIDEVVALFPGKYIHIGGDEAPKTRWKNCNHCQQLIQKENLKDEHGLQSYFIQRMEKYINSKGKQIIGWDEILEGGLAPNATVMSWRGVNGAVQAAKEGHDVILTPTSHCYFDYYQSDGENEPLAIGGFLPLEKVYSFNPIPEELNDSESKHVLGAQGNVWTEYMPNEKKVEYMAFPRAVALSEVVWSSPKNMDYADFTRRLESFQKRLDLLNVNYANHLYEISGTTKSIEGKMYYELNTTSKDSPIYYSTDSLPPARLYNGPIPITASMIIKAVVKGKNNEDLSQVFEQRINAHKAFGKNVLLSKEPHKTYSAGGKEALINGVSGSDKRYGDKEWLGFSGEDVVIMIDLGEFKTINSVATRFHNGNGQWIYAPKKINLYFDMGNGKEISFDNFFKPNDSLLVNFKVNLTNIRARRLRITVPNYGEIPAGKQGAGHKAWTFIDEIIIE
ncbi:family 20 glycosylhydrolase [Flavobacteriaceae bacterium S356]|uniref:beta-N-acetylhexosaminidase n=1 Tax=Asprobacillus argus TaxID=3076534 RepID=A0ABU3LH50_9FLAO|nr:family 20 glycosylhydrolase [Flavobacteriaceae bacterium S356]